MKIPTFEAVIDKDGGITCISFVDNPATQIDMLLFSETEKQKLNFSDDEKHMVTSVVMLADTKIYRELNNEPFYIVYSKDTLKQMAQKMLSDNTFNEISFNHNGVLLEPGQIELVELYTTDEYKKSPFNIPEGSLVATYKVLNDEIWEFFKSGEISGISLEGTFNVIEQNFSETIAKYKNTSSKFMNILESLKKLIVDYEAETVEEVEHEETETVNEETEHETVDEHFEETVPEDEDPENPTDPEDPEDPANPADSADDAIEAIRAEFNTRLEEISANIETVRSEMQAIAGRLDAIENTLKETAVPPIEELKEDEQTNKFSRYAKLYNK